MNDINNIFFELIRVAIGNAECLSHTPTNAEWMQLYELAKKQSLVGICFAGVQKLTIHHSSLIVNLSESLRLQWMGMAAKIQQRNETVNRQCVELQAKLSADGFRSYIMKGQGNAALYRVVSSGSKEFQVSGGSSLSGLRQSGDIDVYLEGGFEKVNAFVQRTHPTNEINELEIHYHCLPDTEVEIHYRPFILRNPIKNARLQRFFNEAMRFDNKLDLPNGVGSINVPTAEFNLVHQMVHIAHHLYTDGIGFRQLMDYFFVVLSIDKEIQKFQIVSEVQRVVDDLGLNRFASALMWVIKTVFVGHDNDDDNDNFFPWRPNVKDGRLLLDEILMSGNFGHTDERAKDIQTSRWKAFWFVNGKTFRFWRFDHWAWFWSPVWRAYHFCWRKMNGFK